MKLTLLFVFLFSVLSFSCAKENSKHAATPIESKHTASDSDHSLVETLPNGITLELGKAVSLNEDLDNYSDFEANLNQYEIKITVPQELMSGLKVKKAEITSGTLEIDPNFGVITKLNPQVEGGNYVIILKDSLWPAIRYDQSGDEVKVIPDFRAKSVIVKVEFEGKNIADLRKEFLPDLVINNSKLKTLKSLGLDSEEFYFGTIFLKKNSILKIENISTILHVDRFFAEDATIETFNDDEVKNSVDGFPGISGGHFKIFANQVKGILTVNMRGTAGGKGRDIEKRTDIPQKAKNGANGSSELVCKMGSIKGGGEDHCNYKCVTQPTNGDTGLKGFKGLPGGTGFSGGSSGSFSLIAQSKKDFFEVSAEILPGLGGIPGKSGEGGPGGEGGEPGSTVKSCGNATKGATGAQGDIGDPGIAGKDGEKENSSVVVEGLEILKELK